MNLAKQMDFFVCTVFFTVQIHAVPATEHWVFVSKVHLQTAPAGSPPPRTGARRGAEPPAYSHRYKTHI